MVNKFPHLDKATGFPGLGEPYAQYKNDFDYSRWGVGTELVLCNVPWDATNNVVDWTGTSLDEYADGIQDSERITLNSEINILPDNVVRIPLPATNAQRWNYVIVRMKTPTSAEQPLDYADGTRIGAYGYFIRDVKQIAASTTECHIMMDYWSTYINHITVQSMMLERGHAPMAKVNADEYLANPLENNQYLLTDDVSFGEPVITTNTQFHSWCATTQPLMMFAITATMDELKAILETKPVNGKTTEPTFSDRNTRWGKQWVVNNYDYGELTKYSNASIRPTITATTSGLPTGVNMFAIKSTDVDAFLRAVQTDCPQLFTLVNSVYMITGELVSTRAQGTFHDIEWYEVLPLNELPSIPVKLTKDDFGYDDHYADIAKLYTYPYAGLTFSDNDGHSVDVRIEYTTPDLGINRRVSLAYPYIKAQAFISGYKGTGNTAYSWIDVNGITRDGTMPASAWQETMLEYDIPSYALAADGHTQWLLHNANSALKTRLQALNDYHTTVRGINTTYENTIDSAETSFGNSKRSADTTLYNAREQTITANTNTNAALDTNKTNGLASNATSKDNADRSNIASRDNSLDSTKTSRTNALSSNELALNNANRSADNGYSNVKTSTDAQNDALDLRNTNADDVNVLETGQSRAITVQGNEYALKLVGDVQESDYNIETPFDVVLDSDGLVAGWSINRDVYKAWTDLDNPDGLSVTNKILQDNAMDNYYDRETAKIDNLEMWATAIAGATNGAVSMISGVPTGEGSGPAAATGGGAATLATSISQGAEKLMWNTVNNKVKGIQEILNLIKGFEAVCANIAQTKASTEANTLKTTTLNNYSEAFKDKRKELDTKTTKVNVDAALTNAAATRDTSKTNASASKTTGDSNAQRSYDTSVANTNRSYSTTSTNIDATKATGDANVNRTYDTGKANQDRVYKTAMGGLYTAADGTSVGTLKRSYDTTIGNITRTKNTTEANAGYSQDTSINTAQTKLKQAQDMLVLDSDMHKNDAPVMIGTRSGDPIPDLYGYRGVQVRVNTQPKSAIDSAGSYFMRYGYALDQYWTMTTWTPMNHFTYWKARDVWMTSDTTVIQDARQYIHDVLVNGTTIWKDPAEIGAVDIYDNRRVDDE